VAADSLVVPLAFWASVCRPGRVGENSLDMGSRASDGRIQLDAHSPVFVYDRRLMLLLAYVVVNARCNLRP